MSRIIIRIKTIAESINTKLMLGLIFISVGLVTVHRMGALDIEKNLLHESNHVSHFTYGSDDQLIKHSRMDEHHTITCKNQKPSSYSYCGLTFQFDQGQPQHGINLSRYHSIALDVELDVAVEDPRVRVSFRNFSEDYSKVGDPVSLKFNSISYAPSKYPGEIVVPLNTFQVESWWVEQKNVEFANAQLDFSNVARMEFVTDTLSEDTVSTLIIRRATIYGELVSERLLIWLLAGFSLFIICMLIAAQHYKLHRASITDTLTGLYNRRGLHDWVSSAISHRKSTHSLTMFYFDIDDFKKVNDSYGHLVGDELLRAFCDLINTFLTERKPNISAYTFGRLSGDEFALILQDLDREDIEIFANDILLSSETPLDLSSGTFKLNFSLGIASSDDQTSSFDGLLSKADSAMYHAKNRGKGQFKIFDHGVAEDIVFRKKIAEKLAIALKRRQFYLVFMPIFHTQSQQIVGCEVLLRCGSKDLKGIGPDKFIPIAEKFNLIEKIDFWVLETTFKKITTFRNLLPYSKLSFSINISASQLHNRYFTRHVQELVKRYEIDTSFIEFEITETSLIETDAEAISTLQELQDIGIRLSLDDFGTGYTAFNQLLNYPVQCLKIDKSFTDKIPKDKSQDVVMVNAVLSIADSYKLKTTAEGIEHAHQLEYMKNHCCDRVQGYFLSKPLPFEEFLECCIQKNSKPLPEFS